MKKAVINFLCGLPVIIAVTIIEFLVTLPFGDPWQGGTAEINSDTYAVFINKEFLLTAIPALLVTFLFAWLLRTKTLREAWQRSIIWTVVIILYYLLIGLGNSNLHIIYGNIGIYVLLGCAFAGPVLYAKIKHLP